jgi:hypothetical protein
MATHNQPGDLRVNRANLLRRVGRVCFDVGATPALPAPAQVLFGPAFAPLTLLFDHAHEAAAWAERYDLHRKEWVDSGVRFVEATGHALADGDGNGGVELTVHGYSAVDVSAPADTDPDLIAEHYDASADDGYACACGEEFEAEPPLMRHIRESNGAVVGLVDNVRRETEDGNGEAKPAHVEGHAHERGKPDWATQPSGEHKVIEQRGEGWRDEATGLVSGGLVASCSVCGHIDEDEPHDCKAVSA